VNHIFLIFPLLLWIIILHHLIMTYIHITHRYALNTQPRSNHTTQTSPPTQKITKPSLTSPPAPPLTTPYTTPHQSRTHTTLTSHSHHTHITLTPHSHSLTHPLAHSLTTHSPHPLLTLIHSHHHLSKKQITTLINR
jgi:hypothetical protein